MHRRLLFKKIRSLAALAALFLFLGSSACWAQQPNILFIYSDDHAANAVSCYGSYRNETPHIDRIAREGMRFDNCFVTNSLCGPCRAVVLTGRYSHQNGITRNGQRFNGAQLTFPKVLQQSGYETACVGKWHLDSDPTGFDYWNILDGQGRYYNSPMLTQNGQVEHEGYTTDVITDLTLEWLEEGRDPSKPFFIMSQHKAPHSTWEPGPDHLNSFNDVEYVEPANLLDDYSHRNSGASRTRMTIRNHMNARHLKIGPPRSQLTPSQRALWDAAFADRIAEYRQLPQDQEIRTRWKYQQYMRDYMRCIASIDDNVGRLLDYLDESGLAENTIVIYTSDQGFFLGEHGYFDKRWMYEEALRAPLVVRWPENIAVGSVEDNLVLNLDLAQTFIDIAGAEDPEVMQGRSMLPLLRGENVEDWRESVYYHYVDYPGPNSVPRHYGIRTDRYKLIHYYQQEEWELFDLESDPDEMHNVYEETDYAEVVAELQVKLNDLRVQYEDDN